MFAEIMGSHCSIAWKCVFMFLGCFSMLTAVYASLALFACLNDGIAKITGYNLLEEWTK